MVDLGYALLAERVPEDNERGDLGHGYTRRLGEEGHRTRRAGINLDDIYLVVLVDDELYVEQSDDADRSPLLRDAVVGMGANVPIPLTRLKISSSPRSL